MKNLIKLWSAFNFAGIATIELIPCAFNVRGYWAVGGEWFLVAAIAIVGWKLGGFLASVF